MKSIQGQLNAANSLIYKKYLYKSILRYNEFVDYGSFSEHNTRPKLNLLPLNLVDKINNKHL